MEIGVLVAFGGSFWASELEIRNIMQSPDGLEWNLALSDGWHDPNYCKAKLRITKFDPTPPIKGHPNCKFLIEGSIVFKTEPEPWAFDGCSDANPGFFEIDGQFENYFIFLKDGGMSREEEVRRRAFGG